MQEVNQETKLQKVKKAALNIGKVYLSFVVLAALLTIPVKLAYNLCALIWNLF